MDRTLISIPPIEDPFVPAVVPDDSSLENIISDLRRNVNLLRGCVNRDASLEFNVDLCLLKLREGNRLLSNLILCKKKRAYKAKHALEKIEGPRQHAIYQKYVVQQTIDQVKHHPSLYMSIPLEDESTTTTTTTNDMEIDDSQPEHDQMLYCLQRELDSRKAMNDRLKASQDARELTRSRLVLKRKELEKLRDQIEGIIKSADPLAHTHQRLFHELRQRKEIGESPPNIPTQDDTLNPIMVLFEKLSKWAEGQEGVQGKIVEELEPGEDDSLLDDRRECNDSDLDEEVTSAVDDNQENVSHSHARFSSTSNRFNHRKFSRSYIQVTVEDHITIYIYETDGIMVAQLESSIEQVKWSNLEDPGHWLTQIVTRPDEEASERLNLDQELQPMAFLWLQCLSGLSPTQPAYADPSGVFDALFSSLKQLAKSHD